MISQSKTILENCAIISGDLRESDWKQINHQFDQLDQRCVGMIDFALANNNSIFVATEIAEKKHHDLLGSIRYKEIFDHLVGFSLGKLGNGVSRICFFFNGSTVQIDTDLAKVIESEYVIRVPAGIENHHIFITNNTKRMPLGAMDNPDQAFSEILSVLAERFGGKPLSARDSSTCCN